MKIKYSNWSKSVKKAMIDRDMDMNDVAERMKWTPQYTSSIINGRTYQREAVVKLSYLFQLDVPEGKTLAMKIRGEK